ncbi:hypothetical protein [Neisseria zalophi]|uniref:hypothetical protein n=1 Tax=Neisseria zalophi TaxID=640030 RepID=UPI001CDA19B2|nr:hypothetical protein [Neisseria zalophi]
MGHAVFIFLIKLKIDIGYKVKMPKNQGRLKNFLMAYDNLRLNLNLTQWLLSNTLHLYICVHVCILYDRLYIINRFFEQMSISERVNLVLKNINLKIKEFSDRSGVAYRGFQNYLSGEREPNAESFS